MEYRLQDTWSPETHDNQGGILVKSIIRREELEVSESAIGVLHNVRLDPRLAPIGQRDAEEIAECLFFCEAFFKKEKTVEPGQGKALGENTPVIMTCLEKVPEESWPYKLGYFNITGVVLHAHADRLEIECTPHTRFIACYEEAEPASDHELLSSYERSDEQSKIANEVAEGIQSEENQGVLVKA